MPELPEVEMVVRTLRPRLVGQRIAKVESSGLPLRKPVELRALNKACMGARVEAVRRIGKYWLIDLSNEHVLIGHLGMTGRLLFAPAKDPREPHTHVVFTLGKGVELRYVDPRRFGVLRAYTQSEAPTSPELSVLGMDPLEPEFTPAHLQALLDDSRRDLKAFLMDQGRIAGLGNIYVCEALFHAQLSPTRRADTVGSARGKKLHAAIIKVLRESIDNRGTSFSDYVDADGNRGGNQHSLWVYGREGESCRRCGSRIKRLVQGSRSTFFCAKCQK